MVPIIPPYQIQSVPHVPDLQRGEAHSPATAMCTCAGSQNTKNQSQNCKSQDTTAVRTAPAL